MKRIISILLALITLLSLCACGGERGIELTLENYEDYLKIYSSISMPYFGEDSLYVGNYGGIPYKSEHGGSGKTFYLSKNFGVSTSVEGISSNFNYEDVSITVKVDCTYNRYDLNKQVWDNGGHSFETELEVNCDIAGDGHASTTIQVEPYVCDKMASRNFEVVAISGRVVPVG